VKYGNLNSLAKGLKGNTGGTDLGGPTSLLLLGVRFNLVLMCVGSSKRLDVRSSNGLLIRWTLRGS
jgi:hypothetical protein